MIKKEELKMKQLRALEKYISKRGYKKFIITTISNTKQGDIDIDFMNETLRTFSKIDIWAIEHTIFLCKETPEEYIQIEFITNVAIMENKCGHGELIIIKVNNPIKKTGEKCYIIHATNKYT